MIAIELTQGEYFQSKDGTNDLVLGRRIDDVLYFFDMKSTKGGVAIAAAVENWTKSVEAISFQKFIELLAGECAQENQPVSELNKENTIPNTALRPGQFFIDPNDDAIGRRYQYPEDIVVYWNPTPGIISRSSMQLLAKEVVPITLPQAVLFQLTKQLKG